MGCVEHIGRIGALAVALGVAAAVASTPAVGYAAPATADPAAGESPTSTSESRAGGASTDASWQPGRPSSPATDDTDETSSAPRHTLLPSEQSIDITPATVLGNSSSASASTEADDHDFAVAERSPSGNRSHNVDGDTLVATATTLDPTLDPTVDSVSRQTSGANQESAYGDVIAAGSVRMDSTSQTSEEIESQPDPAGGEEYPAEAVTESAFANVDVIDGTAALTVASPPEEPTQPELVKAEPSPGPAFTDLFSTLAGLPRNPTAPSPALWTLLAAARREIGQTENAPGPTPNAATSPAATQTASPAMTALSSVLSPLGDLVAKIGMFAKRQLDIYDFGDPNGWAAFLLDYTWGLPGTTTGMVVQVINTFFWPTDPGYRDDLSYHQNLHVYEGGITFSAYASCQTWGNVITNAGANRGGSNPPGIDPEVQMHESVHIWQSRLAGPLFQATYAGWLVGGSMLAAMIYLSDPSQDLYELVYEIGYYTIPWEKWARDIAP